MSLSPEKKTWLIFSVIHLYALIPSDIPKLTRAIMLEKWDSTSKQALQNAVGTWQIVAPVTEVGENLALIQTYMKTIII